MNCQEFETTIIEIARDRLMDASMQERGLKHAETCKSCAALLAEERALNEKLRAFSVADAGEEIPANLETAVLAAFRQGVIARNAGPATSTSLSRQRWFLMAAAALLLLAIGLSLAGWFASRPQIESIAIKPKPEQVTLPAKTYEKDETSQQARLEMVAIQSNLSIRDAKPGKRRKRLPKTGNNTQPAGDGQQPEIVSQFYPINLASELIPLEGAQILRVRMPRSNLGPLGIPFNQERADETIQADVLVSNDGLARAIRLVY